MFQKVPIALRKAVPHGLILLAVLAISQSLLDANQNGFLLYMPPIGFVFFLVTSYFIQPLVIGIVNVVVFTRLYHCERCQIGFWLNGLFLFLTFSTLNLLLQTVWAVPFTMTVAVAEVILLCVPFGFLGRFTNGGYKPQSFDEPTQPRTERTDPNQP